ncbi:MAG TPA: ATP-binding protein [Bryobacteraceae bacterium]|nr:ATP-binding protein [Bryobacteraceae bacterium]
MDGRELERLQKSEARYRSLAEAVPQLVWTCAPDGRCDYMNARWLEYTGMPAGQLSAPVWIEVLHPDDRERATAAWEKSLRDLSPFEAEYRLRAKDGSYRWFQTRGVSVLNQGGEALYWAGTSTDIQDRKAAEEALSRHVEALARSNADLKQFAYVASHDLQEPLRTIVSYTQLLRKRYKNQLGPEGEEFLEYAAEGARQMQRLIKDLLAYSSSTRERELARRPTDCEYALQTALRNLAAGVRESGASVTHDSLPKVYAHPTQIVRVFQNLIGNSIKYRRAGEPLRIHVAAGRDGGHWRLSVRDNGRGFEPGESERIFGVFQRLQDRSVPGTGIGLAICKRIVEAHGGRIWAESKPGEGATFFFTLPEAVTS